MAEVFRFPDLGEGLHEAELIAWHVGAGDHVVADQPLVTVDTDKAMVEVPSPRTGWVESVSGAPGDMIEVGAPLVTFRTEPTDDAGAIVGDLPADHRPVAQAQGAKPEARVKAAPAVRKLALERHVDLATVAPSGPDDTVTKADVERATSATPAGTVIRGVRRAMLKNMARAGREVVHATVTEEADVDPWFGKDDITVRMMRAMVVGCRASPSLNAWFDASTETRTLHRRIDLGIAVETDEGLFAPVIRDIGRLDPRTLRGNLDAIKGEVAARSIPRDTLRGATITLSNFGTFGGRFAELVVIPPQVAILGAGKATARVVPVGDQPAIRRVLPLSLSFDHRVVTGVEAMRFLDAVIEDLQRPE